MCKIRNATDNSKKLLKVINISELDIDVVDEVVTTMNRINNMNIGGLMKYELIENDENVLYRVMVEYKVHLDRLNPLKYFEDSGPFEVLNGVLLVLKGLNDAGTFHSDLKPSNIFLNEENEIIIGDYLNNILYKGREGKKISGKMDDFCFICIDELLGKELDISSDIWNFGLIFYYILSGKYPFIGENIKETIDNLFNVKYNPLDDESGSNRLNSFLNKILVKQKAKRLSINQTIKQLKKLNELEIPSTPFDDEENEFPSVPTTPITETIKVADWMKDYIKSRIEGFKKSNQNELSFVGDDMQDEEMKYIYSILDSPMNNITKINLSGHHITSIGLTYISYSLQYFPNIEYINLSSNSIGNGGGGMKVFSETLHYIPNLKELVMIRCDLRDSDIKYLASHLIDIQYLDKLNLSNNKISDYGVRYICDNIDDLTKLQDLHLENNEIGDKGGDMLFDNLEKYKNFRWLYIHHNKISNYENFIQKIRDKCPDKKLNIM